MYVCLSWPPLSFEKRMGKSEGWALRVHPSLTHLSFARGNANVSTGCPPYGELKAG